MAAMFRLTRASLRWARLSAVVAGSRWAGELRSSRRVSKKRTVERYFRAIRCLYASRSCNDVGTCAWFTLGLVSTAVSCFVAATACVTRTSAHRPTSMGFRACASWSWTGPRPHQDRPLVSRDVCHGSERATKQAATRYKMIKKPVTSVAHATTAVGIGSVSLRWLRGRDSNPNFLVQSQASYR